MSNTWLREVIERAKAAAESGPRPMLNGWPRHLARRRAMIDQAKGDTQ